MSLKKSVLLLLLFLLIGVPLTWYTIVFPYDQAESFFKNAPVNLEAFIDSTYPKDLEVEIVNGNVSINKDTPYCLITNKQSNFGILFDPNFQAAMLRPDILATYPLCVPLAVVGTNTLTYFDSETKDFVTKQIPATANLEINQNLITNFTSNQLPVFVKWGWMGYMIAPFLIILLAYSSIMFTNIWYALILFIIFNLIDNDEYSNFKKSFALSLRIFTLILIGRLVLYYLNYYSDPDIIFNIPFFNTVAILIIALTWTKFFGGQYFSDYQSAKSRAATSLQTSEVPNPNQSPLEVKQKTKEEQQASYTFDPSVISPPPNEVNIPDPVKKS